jgi:hypothetical protein
MLGVRSCWLTCGCRRVRSAARWASGRGVGFGIGTLQANLQLGASIRRFPRAIAWAVACGEPSWRW